MKLIMLALVFLSTSLSAAPGLWFEPARDGHGLTISRDSGFGSAVIWYGYTPEGEAVFLIGGKNCTAFPCVIAMHQPSASWMGGQLDIGPPVGEMEIGIFDGAALPVRYDFRAWQPELCSDISPGGVIFRRCAGRIDFELLAQ